jgi:hypothetical protein
MFSFGFYTNSKNFFDNRFYDLTGRSPLVLAETPGRSPTLDTIACFGLAGMSSGALITTLSCPFELIKLNMQLAGKEARKQVMQLNGRSTTDANKKRPGSFAILRQQYKLGGFLRCYAGYRLHLARDVIGTGVYFATYETVKQVVNNLYPDHTAMLAIPIAGGFCGMASWTVVCCSPNSSTQMQN